MTDREKLIALLCCAPTVVCCDDTSEILADHLLANGVRLETKQATSDKTSKWISVEERLPETDNKNTFAYNVLVYIPKIEGCNQHGVYIGQLKGIKADDGSGNFWGIKRPACDWTVWGFSYFEQPVVTHWMPLPEPPLDTTNQAADL